HAVGSVGGAARRGACRSTGVTFSAGRTARGCIPATRSVGRTAGDCAARRLISRHRTSTAARTTPVVGTGAPGPAAGAVTGARTRCTRGDAWGPARLGRTVAAAQRGRGATTTDRVRAATTPADDAPRYQPLHRGRGCRALHHRRQ